MLHSSRGGQRISALTFPLGGGFNPPSALSTTTAHQQQSEIPANLLCSHCKGIFDEPLLLSCGHSFCRRCVEPWLRQSTNCPYCRSTTLAPIRNFTLAEKVADYKRRNGKAKGEGDFIRSFVRRSMHPSKEAKTLQREALRASQRRPKNVVLPEREASAHPPNPTPPNVRQMAASLEKKIRLIGEQQKMGTAEKDGKDKMAKDGDGTFPRMGNLRRSFARIRNKMATGKQQNADEAEPIQQRKPTAIVVGVRSSNSVSALNNNQFNSPTIGELMARSRTPTSMGRMDGIGFTEINLQTPGSLSRISCSTADHRRPSMGISGSALRRNNSPAAEEKAPPPSPQQPGNGPKLNDEGGGEGNAGKGGGGPNTSAGCVLM